MIDKDGFRPNVGIILANSHGQVLWAKRLGWDAWQFPQGGIDAHETPEQALFRELKEEIGYGANKLTFLKTITLAPGYQSSETHIVLAEDLYEETAEGDEPEPLEIVQHKLSELEKLTYSKDLTEARSILALFMARELLLSRRTD